MAVRNDENVLVLAGTRDGLYLFDGTCRRDEWTRRGPFLEGCDVSHATLDHRNGRTIWAAASGNGSTAVYRSDDRGETWRVSGGAWDVEQIWHVEPGHASQPWRVYAGVKPAALYRSDDGGESWQELPALSNHPSHTEWWGGGAGLILHTIVPDEQDPDDLYVGMSVAGVFHTADGGKSWAPRNEGVFSFATVAEPDAPPAQFPEVHRCVHKMVRHPQDSNVLYQQNHMGVYRSDDRGHNWVDIGAGLPSIFGFAICITRDGGVYVVPQDENTVRFSGQLTVYRTRDGGLSWDALTAGLPQIENLTLYREGMATDGCTPGGIYFGTSEGDLFHSRDGGDQWQLLASGLPGVRSVSCEHWS